MAGWKTQVAALLEAPSDEALSEALSEFLNLSARDR
jgi:hypothetical protein